MDKAADEIAVHITIHRTNTHTGTVADRFTFFTGIVGSKLNAKRVHEMFEFIHSIQ